MSGRHPSGSPASFGPPSPKRQRPSVRPGRPMVPGHIRRSSCNPRTPTDPGQLPVSVAEATGPVLRPCRRSDRSGSTMLLPKLPHRLADLGSPLRAAAEAAAASWSAAASGPPPPQERSRPPGDADHLFHACRRSDPHGQADPHPSIVIDPSDRSHCCPRPPSRLAPRPSPTTSAEASVAADLRVADPSSDSAAEAASSSEPPWRPHRSTATAEAVAAAPSRSPRLPTLRRDRSPDIT